MLHSKVGIRRVQSDVCLSFCHVKKGQHAAVMDLRVGGFLRLLQVAQLLKF